MVNRGYPVRKGNGGIRLADQVAFRQTVVNIDLTFAVCLADLAFYHGFHAILRHRAFLLLREVDGIVVCPGKNTAGER